MGIIKYECKSAQENIRHHCINIKLSDQETAMKFCFSLDKNVAETLFCLKYVTEDEDMAKY